MRGAGVGSVRAGRGGSAGWWLGAAALTVAVSVAPGLIAGWTSGGGLTVAGLPSVVGTGFARWVDSGRATVGPGLASAVSFWMTFHVVKAVAAAGLLAVLARGCRCSWSALVQVVPGERRPLVWCRAAVCTVAAPVVLLVVVANVQGAVAPLSSVLTFLPTAGPAPTQLRAELLAGGSSPVLTALTGDFRLYHAALAVCLVPVIVTVVGVVVWLWTGRRRTPTTQRRRRRILTAGGVLLPVLPLFLGVVLAANVSTVADTAPALAAFLGGGGM